MRKQLSFSVVSLLLAMATFWGSTLSGSQDRDKSSGIPDRKNPPR
jgi:hypothetical protein